MAHSLAVAAPALRLATVASRPTAILAPSVVSVPSGPISSSTSRFATHISWSSHLPATTATGLPRFYTGARGASSYQSKQEDLDPEDGSGVDIDDFDSEDLDGSDIDGWLLTSRWMLNMSQCRAEYK